MILAQTVRLANGVFVSVMVVVSSLGCELVETEAARSGAADAAASAAASTRVVREVQPRPNTGQVESARRKRSLSRVSARMAAGRSAALAAAMVLGPTRPSSLAPTTAWSARAARAGPEFTAKSKTARSSPGGSSSPFTAFQYSRR